MKLKDFSHQFLNAFPTTIVTQKKPINQLKRYLLFSRGSGYACANFVQSFLLLKRIVFFLQTAVANQTEVTFFFDNWVLAPLYYELTLRCNTNCAYTPRVYGWLSSWTPGTLGKGGGCTLAACSTYVKSLAIFCDMPSLFVPSLLIKRGFPLIACLDVSVSVSSSLSTVVRKSLYLLPTPRYITVDQQYFLLAFFCKVVGVEKARHLV